LLLFQKRITCLNKLLKEAWGILVPKPIFVSEAVSGGIMFLGVQLGRMVQDNDDISQYEDIFRQLRYKYGVAHDDMKRSNVIFIHDTETSEE
jgi:hypothetical protein